MFCKSCGKQISKHAKFCEFCGAPLTDENAPRRKNGTSVLTIVLVALLTAFVLSVLCALGFFAYMRFIAPSTESPFESQATLPTQIHTEPATQASEDAHPFLGLGSPLFPDSSDRYLIADDLVLLTAEELTIARCEIPARYGVIFNDPDIAYYFEQQDWYIGSVAQDDFDTASLNDFETGNIQLIEIYENILNGGYEPSANNPYLAYYDPSLELLIPYSSNTRLTTQDLVGLTPEQLIILRNQIIALHGYTFGDQLLMEYFLQCSWYHPSTPPGRTDLVKGMTSLEYDNMEFIYQYEKNHASAIVPGSITGSWMIVGSQNPIGYRVRTYTFNADGTYEDFVDVYEISMGKWHASGLGDSTSIGNYNYQSGTLYMYNDTVGIPPNESESGEWEWKATNVTYSLQITISEDGNTLYIWQNNQIASQWMRVIGSTSSMMDSLYPHS